MDSSELANLDRPETTLFLLSSVDGKISTGASKINDFDSDLPSIGATKKGLCQYYSIERQTSPFSLMTGKTFDKLGINKYRKPNAPNKRCVSYIIIDNTHLNKQGIKNICNMAANCILITTNINHPANEIKDINSCINLHTIYQQKLDLRKAFKELREIYACASITIQSGGTFNGYLLREHLIDNIGLVMAPILVGGKETPTVIDGTSLTDINHLSEIGELELTSMEALKKNYIHLKYRVLNSEP